MRSADTAEPTDPCSVSQGGPGESGGPGKEASTALLFPPGHPFLGERPVAPRQGPVRPLGAPCSAGPPPSLRGSARTASRSLLLSQQGPTLQFCTGPQTLQPALGTVWISLAVTSLSSPPISEKRVPPAPSVPSTHRPCCSPTDQPLFPPAPWVWWREMCCGSHL